MSEDALAAIGWTVGIFVAALLELGVATLVGAMNVLVVFLLGAAFGLPASLLGVAVAVRLHPDCKERGRQYRAEKARTL